MYNLRTFENSVSLHVQIHALLYMHYLSISFPFFPRKSRIMCILLRKFLPFHEFMYRMHARIRTAFVVRAVLYADASRSIYCMHTHIAV